MGKLRFNIMKLPEYYSRLALFEEFFLLGQPILTYHHIGSRPIGARLKGLYLSQKLFAQHLSELTSAGFKTPSFEQVANIGSNPQRNIFLTFDDAFCDVFEHALPILQAYGLRGILFLVADLIGKTNEWQQRQGDVIEPLMDTAQVREWLAAGHEIGSHTLTHPRLTQLPMSTARHEIVASKKKLEDMFGRSVCHFCYPYGDWNETVCELVKEAGYQTACTTDLGVNDANISPFALKRITARYSTRKWKTLIKRLFFCQRF